MKDVHIIIPARLQSTRLPRKLLLDLGGQTVLERVFHQAKKAGAASITIATDSEEIKAHAENFCEVVMTSSEHQSGTDRIAEVVLKKSINPDSIIVNVQGDEPFIDPKLIIQVAQSLRHQPVKMATLCWPIQSEAAFLNPNVVKLVRDREDNALYFSRATIPFGRDTAPNLEMIYRHIGLYAYRASFLLTLVQTQPCELEKIEALEQLRVLYMGEKIHTPIAAVAPKQDINTLEDLEAARYNVIRSML